MTFSKNVQNQQYGANVSSDDAIEFEGVVTEGLVINEGKETPLRSGGLSKDEKREYKKLKAKKGANELSKHEKKRYKESYLSNIVTR